jgi:hypothetical protein
MHMKNPSNASHGIAGIAPPRYYMALLILNVRTIYFMKLRLYAQYVNSPKRPCNIYSPALIHLL